MNLSDFTEPQQRKAAEFICEKVNFGPIGFMAGGKAIYNYKPLLTSTDEALKAVEKADLWCEIHHRNAMPPDKAFWSLWVSGKTDLYISVNTLKDLPAAVVLCCAMAMGWKASKEQPGCICYQGKWKSGCPIHGRIGER